MSIAKLRGKSALVKNDCNNTLTKSYVPQTSLLKIEPFVPSFTTRLRRPIHRSYSTLSSTYFKRLIDQKNQHQHTTQTHRLGNSLARSRNGIIRQRSKSSISSSSACGISQQSNGICTVTRTQKEQEKLPDRINFDRRGLTSIPIFENEKNLRLLSLQHNLINVFHITDEKAPEEPCAPEQVKKPQNPNMSPVTAAVHSQIKASFMQKPSLIQAHHNYYSSMKKSKSFMTNYSKHLNALKRNLQKCTIENGHNGNLMSLDKASPETDAQTPEHLEIKSTPIATPYGSTFHNLVFLDLYDNQIEKISTVDGLKSLTVLLLGKNRITDISGIESLKSTLRVLDLHGNKITSIANKINCLRELKSLNLAGNQIRQINQNDFAGLMNLKELNLKRNKIKRIYGFHHLTNLERLWLCHNDLHKVDDMATIAKAVNLHEVTIENNPVSLAGDCVSFLVSYLSKLMLLSQMPITDQVRKAALAWRKNKEISDSNYSNLSSDVFNSIRREEVISNARTNWELLRSQQMLTAGILSGPKGRQLQQIPEQIEKDRNTDIMNIEAKNDKSDDYVRFPPILQPLMESNLSSEKTHSSGSSLGPNIDSSSSCFSSDNEDKDGAEKTQQSSPAIRVSQINEQPPFDSEDVLYEIEQSQYTQVYVIEEDSVSAAKTVIDVLNQSVGGKTNSSNESDKGSNISSVTSETVGVAVGEKSRSHKNAQTKRYMNGSLLRSQTQATRSSNNRISSNTNHNSAANNANSVASVTTLMTTVTKGSSQAQSATGNGNPNKQVVEREREQGGDYLIEICGRYLNIYGLGALRFIDKQWNTQKANDVHTLNFSYINFNNISTVLGRIKTRFPHAENFVFRETNICSLGQLNALAELQGIQSLVVDAEGNGITSREWRSYAVYRLSHWGLKIINGTEVTESEIELSHREYMGLSDLVLWSLPESMLQPLLARLRLEETCSASKLSAKEWLMRADQSLRIVVGKEALQWKKTGEEHNNTVRDRGRMHFSMMIENTCNAVEKLQRLETMWTNMLLDITRTTLLDYSQLDVYLKTLTKEVLK